MNFGPVNHILATPIKDPTLLGLSLTFAGILFATNQQANMYDVQNPRWVITMAALILISPLAHAVFLMRMRGDLEQRDEAPITAGLAAGGALYTRLVGGEILIGLISAAGMLLFILPGIYIGLRLSFYKQAIILDRKTISGALRESMARTVHLRPIGVILLIYAPIYAGEILVAYAVSVFPMGIFGPISLVIVSGLGFAWINALITAIYLRQTAQ